MASAGTAYVDIKPDMSGFTKELDRNLSGTKSKISKFGKAATAGFALGGIGALTAGLGKAVGEFEEARKVAAQTNQVIKSTGGVAKITAKDVEKLSGAISKKAGIDDEAIQSGANLLLTFTNIRNEAGKGNKIFDQSTQAITDMSVALGQDMKSSAIQVGKALNDPIKGVTALSRVGVSFTAQQKEQIKTLVKSGDTLGAQKIILGELRKEFGGSAAAQATALDKLKVKLGNIAESVGSVLVPALDKLAVVFIAVSDGIGKAVGWFRQHETITLALATAVGTLATAFAAMTIVTAVTAGITALSGALIFLQAPLTATMLLISANPIGALIIALAALTAGVVVAYQKSETFRDVVDTAFGVVKVAARVLWEVIKTYIGGIVTVIKTQFAVIKFVVTTVWDAIKTVTEAVWGALKASATVVWSAIRAVILDPMRDARDKLAGVWDSIKGAAGKAWGALTGGAASAFKGTANVVIGFVNAIIKAINLIPGVPNIPLIAKLATGGKISRDGVDRFARGGIVRKPMAIYGEEAPRHPEFVIPTNPAHRKNALKLTGDLAKRIGFYKRGGIVGAGGPLDAIGSVVSAPLDLLEGGAKAILSKLPSPADLPSWLQGMGKHLISEVTGWIKDKVGSVVDAVIPGGSKMQGGLGFSVLSAIGNALGVHTGGQGQGYRPGDPGWHGKNRARDFSGPPEGMLRFARIVAQRMGPRLLELIHTPLGYGIKNGQQVSNSVYAKVLADHFDHVHVAMARGGLLSSRGAITGPYVGSFASGGTVQRDGLAAVHAGETISPASSRVRVVVEDHRVRVYVDEVEQIVERVTRRQARTGGRVLPGQGGGLR